MLRTVRTGGRGKTSLGTHRDTREDFSKHIVNADSAFYWSKIQRTEEAGSPNTWEASRLRWWSEQQTEHTTVKRHRTKRKHEFKWYIANYMHKLCLFYLPQDEVKPCSKYEAREAGGPSSWLHHLGLPFQATSSVNNPYWFPTGRKEASIALKELRLSHLTALSHCPGPPPLTSPTQMGVLFPHIHMESLLHLPFNSNLFWASVLQKAGMQIMPTSPMGRLPFSPD